MYSLQKLIPNNAKAVFKPGAFSIHQKSLDHSFNKSFEQKTTTSVDLHNQQSLIQLQAQLQLQQQKKTPSKYKSEQNLKSKRQSQQHHQPQQNKSQAELVQMLEYAKNKQSLSPPKKRVQTPKQKSNRKLNFNILQQDNTLSDNSASNAMAQLIMENILNRNDHHDDLVVENKKLKENLHRQQQIINEQKQKLLLHDNQLKSVNQSLRSERSNYETQLKLINEKIQSMKSIKQTLQMEEKKNELLSKQLQEQININNLLTQSISDNCINSIEFLNLFRKSIQSFNPVQGFAVIIDLFKHSTQIVLQTITKTQQLNLPQLRNQLIPEDFNINGFFEMLDSIKQQESPELSFRQKNQSISQVVVNKQTVSSKNVSLQDQFNTFLEQSEPIPDDTSSQLGSPYFTNLDKPMSLQDRFKMQLDKEAKKKQEENVETEKTKQRNQMPRQMTNQISRPKSHSTINIIKCDDTSQYNINASNNSNCQANTSTNTNTNQSNANNRTLKVLNNFQSFNQINNLSYVQDSSEIDTFQYDSLIKELQNEKQSKLSSKDRSSSVHNLKYLDFQIQKEEEKIQRKNKENINQNCQFLIAKYDYKAQKDVDLSFKKGDRIKLLKKTNNGWWYGEDEMNVKGYFPHNFVQLID